MAKINVKMLSEESMKEASYIIKEGGVVVLPTDTNYNVFTHLHSQEGVNRIFEMKKRQSLSPLTLCLGDSMELENYAYTTPLSTRIAKELWPEKINFILYQKPTTPRYITRGLGTVAATLNSYLPIRKIIRMVGVPIAGTSANLSGTGNVPNVLKSVEHIGEKVDLIIDGGVSHIDSANTIIDFTFDNPILVREGAYDKKILLNLIPHLNHTISLDEYKKIINARAQEIN